MKIDCLRFRTLFFRRDWPDLNITFAFTGIDWNPEIGYDKQVPSDAIPWRPYGAGLSYGLTLVLDVDVNEYYCSSTASAGFKVIILFKNLLKTYNKLTELKFLS